MTTRRFIACVAFMVVLIDALVITMIYKGAL
jgi:hypothetical protein